MVKPAVFCTADRGLCGATPTVLERKSGSAPATALYEMLVGMHDPDRMESLFYNYTRILYAADLDVSLVVQRHYPSLEIGTAYANSTYMVRFVCTPLLPMKQYCAGPNVISADYDWYALFVNYDGVLGHGEARINGQDYGPADLWNVSLFDESTLLEAKLLVEHNNLTRGNKIVFLTEHLKNAQIYEMELVPYQNGTAAYEQFEASYLFVCANIARDVRARPEIIQEFTARRDDDSEEQTTEYSPLPDFRRYPRPRWNVTEFDAKAQRFIDEHLDLFVDRGYSTSIYPNRVAVGLTGGLFCFGLLIFILA